jgi:hypothetical protein
MNKEHSREDDARERMLGEMSGGLSEPEEIDCSGLSILARGCDPRMALRAAKMLPPLLGHPEIVSCTDDDDFRAKLKARRWSVVFFAPGACRYSASRMPIPGGRPHTRGWSLIQYRAFVAEHQGEDVSIVETVDEREIVPLLRHALRRCLIHAQTDAPTKE